jgi:hypothetical protein
VTFSVLVFEVPFADTVIFALAFRLLFAVIAIKGSGGSSGTPLDTTTPTRTSRLSARWNEGFEKRPASSVGERPC